MYILVHGADHSPLCMKGPRGPVAIGFASPEDARYYAKLKDMPGLLSAMQAIPHEQCRDQVTKITRQVFYFPTRESIDQFFTRRQTFPFAEFVIDFPPPGETGPQSVAPAKKWWQFWK